MSSFQIQAFILVLYLVVKGDCLLCYYCDDCDVLSECLLQPCDKVVPSTPPPGTATTGIFTTRTSSTKSTTTKSPSTSTIVIPSTSVLPPTPEASTSPTDGTSTTSDGSPITTDESSGSTDESTSTATNTATTTMVSSTLTSTARSDGFNNWKQSQNNQSIFMRAGNTFHCFSIETVEKNKRKMRRGCVSVSERDNACDVLIDHFGCSSRNCKVCSESRCNNSEALVFSLKAWTVIILIRFLL